MSSNEMARKRALMLSARLRFSPETQPVRETAIDKCVEQILLVFGTDSGLTVADIEDQLTTPVPGGTWRLNRTDICSSLKRLMQSRRIVSSGRNSERYCLSPDAHAELGDSQRQADLRMRETVRRLFRNAAGGPAAYTQPFLDFLCIVFAKLGDAYVRQIQGNLSNDDLLTLPAISEAVTKVMADYPDLDEIAFRAASLAFFRDTDPAYDLIKWNFAQHYYVVKILGLDPTGYLLSREVFGDAAFYLDTNVVIHALAALARHHTSFESLSQACDQLNAELNVCQITVDELRRVVAYQSSVIPEVADQIPEDTAPKVRGIFFELYRSASERGETPDIAELFASFSAPTDDLNARYSVRLVDDVWFSEEASNPATESLVQHIRQQYLMQRHRTKSYSSALHDALILRWVHRERRQRPWTWLVTLDTSLPRAVLDDDSQDRPLAITLDALLQWMSPLALLEDSDEQLATIFSQAVGYQLLSTSFLDVRDFLVIAKMDWSCKELPSGDVEELVRYLRTNASDLNPSVPGDREKLAAEFAKFFADPSREYHNEIQRLETQHNEMRTELDSKNEMIEMLRGKTETAMASADEERKARQQLEERVVPQLEDLRRRVRASEELDAARRHSTEIRRLAWAVSAKWLVVLLGILSAVLPGVRPVVRYMAVRCPKVTAAGPVALSVTLFLAVLLIWFWCFVRMTANDPRLKEWRVSGTLHACRQWIFRSLITGALGSALYDAAKSVFK